MVEFRQEEIIEMESPVIGDKIEPEIEKEVINVEVNQVEKLESEGKNEEITKSFGIQKMAIISGTGVRNYYRKYGYELIDTYMVKTLI